jgi:rubrerythrin
MEIVRFLVGNISLTELFHRILTELESGLIYKANSIALKADSAINAKITQHNSVRENPKNLVRCSLTSLRINQDIMESDVPQFLLGCCGCGYITQGEQPDVCPIFGSLGIEF